MTKTKAEKYQALAELLTEIVEAEQKGCEYRVERLLSNGAWQKPIDLRLFNTECEYRIIYPPRKIYINEYPAGLDCGVFYEKPELADLHAQPGRTARLCFVEVPEESGYFEPEERFQFKVEASGYYIIDTEKNLKAPFGTGGRAMEALDKLRRNGDTSGYEWVEV